MRHQWASGGRCWNQHGQRMRHQQLQHHPQCIMYPDMCGQLEVQPSLLLARPEAQQTPEQPTSCPPANQRRTTQSGELSPQRRVGWPPTSDHLQPSAQPPGCPESQSQHPPPRLAARLPCCHPQRCPPAAGQSEPQPAGHWGMVCHLACARYCRAKCARRSRAGVPLMQGARQNLEADCNPWLRVHNLWCGAEVPPALCIAGIVPGYSAGAVICRVHCWTVQEVWRACVAGRRVGSRQPT